MAETLGTDRPGSPDAELTEAPSRPGRRGTGWLIALLLTSWPPAARGTSPMTARLLRRPSGSVFYVVIRGLGARRKAAKPVPA
jgi:hypothetical protein